MLPETVRTFESLLQMAKLAVRGQSCDTEPTISRTPITPIISITPITPMVPTESKEKEGTDVSTVSYIVMSIL